MEHQLHTCIKEATEAMDQTLYRTAINRGFFDLQRHLKWYQRRTAGRMNQKVLNDVIMAQTLILTPFTPHLCEELWQKLGREGFIVNEAWPAFDANKIIPAIEQSEAIMVQVMDDVVHVLKLAKIEKPRKITLFVAENWKAQLFIKLQELLTSTRNLGEIMKTLIPEFKEHNPGQLIQKLVKDPSKIPQHIAVQDTEYQNLMDALPFLKQEYNCTIEVVKEQDSSEAKAKQAMPGKPAMLVE